MIITDLAVFESQDHNSPYRLIELAPGAASEDVVAETTANFIA
jgi:3-oxoacid CoA-transferase subunit B